MPKPTPESGHAGPVDGTRVDGCDVYVVTGGGRGIGAAVVARLASIAGAGESAGPAAHGGAPDSARGGRVIVATYRSDEDAARRSAAELTRPGVRVVPVRCDVGDPAQVDALFDAVDGLGVLVGLVNNAGVLERQTSLTDIDAARWERVLRVNVVGTALCCRAAVVRMRAHDRGPRSIVNLSSRAAELGSPGEYVDYAASKAAVDTLTRGLALEVAGDGIRVNSVRPGIIDTQMHASGGEPGRAARLGPTQPLGRAGDPDEVAAAVTWLLSDDSSFVTGTHVDVSGGR